MKAHLTRRIPLAVAVCLALAVLALGFPASASPDAPNPGHAWTELENHGTSGDPVDTYWLGTTTDDALELRVNGQRALRLEPDATSPNVIGGHSANSVTTGAYGATIGGGGESTLTNRVTDDYGTIAGGTNNQAGDAAGETRDAPYNTVGGGEGNVASASFCIGPDCMGWATVSGGYSNTASGIYGAVGGGSYNTASGGSATVGGGSGNTASGGLSTAGGGSSNQATGQYATVAGGQSNQATGMRATVGGGYSNEATQDHATVAGGYNGSASGNAATVGGGYLNDASGEYATVSGGEINTASHQYATVSGGQGNTASGQHDTVSGGYNNVASGSYSTIGGGRDNTAEDANTTVVGGVDNHATFVGATVLGGANNVASANYSFALGMNAKSNHNGAFVWADSMPYDFASTDWREFSARATGGFRFVSGVSATGTPTSWCNLPAGSGSWSCSSDRNVKANFEAINAQDILDRLADIPIETWNYKAQDDSIRHIGPVAQEFYAAFGLGESETAISTVDVDGVALAAVQGLYELSQEQAARIAALEEENTTLQQRLDDLEARVTAVEEGPGANALVSRASSSGLPLTWLLLGGGLALALGLSGLVLVQRRVAGGQP